MLTNDTNNKYTNSTFFFHTWNFLKRKINNKELETNRIELKARYETYTQWMGRHNPTITEEL